LQLVVFFKQDLDLSFRIHHSSLVAAFGRAVPLFMEMPPNSCQLL
jgi:hypothetical protein